MVNIALIVILFFSSIASANEAIFPDQVVWGEFCGECAIDCITMRKINHSGLEIDVSSRFFKSDPFEYEFRGERALDKDYKKYEWVLDKPIPSIINKNRIVYGQPDAYDQCGYFIDYQANAKNYKVLIDPDRVPDGLKDLVRQLFN
jgi:hypothetical protein